jgi:hypothetical protein
MLYFKALNLSKASRPSAAMSTGIPTRLKLCLISVPTSGWASTTRIGGRSGKISSPQPRPEWFPVCYAIIYFLQSSGNRLPVASIDLLNLEFRQTVLKGAIIMPLSRRKASIGI